MLDAEKKVYCELSAKMKGVNLAQHFGKDSMRTCFGTERCCRSNDGQRIDHIIAQGGLLDDSQSVRITAFNVLQQFGGSKSKGSSDHCPLWCRIERGGKAKRVAIVEEEMSVKRASYS